MRGVESLWYVTADGCVCDGCRLDALDSVPIWTGGGKRWWWSEAGGPDFVRCSENADYRPSICSRQARVTRLDWATPPSVHVDARQLDYTCDARLISAFGSASSCVGKGQRSVLPLTVEDSCSRYVSETDRYTRNFRFVPPARSLKSVEKESLYVEVE